MPIPTLSRAGLDDHLYALGLRLGHHVTVHSRLLALGMVDGGAATVMAALRDAVGPEGTVVVPAYCWQHAPDFVFDPRSTPPEKVGALSTHAWEMGSWSRSPCPIHSHLGFGAKAPLLAAVSGLDSTGPASDFALFRREGFHLLTLGLSLGPGATYLHHVEDCAAVPYRQPLLLSRQRRRPDGAVEPIQMRYYGAASPSCGGPGRWRENFDAVEPHLAAHGALTCAPCALTGYSTYCAIADLHDQTMALLAQDPYALVLPPDETEA